MLHCNFWAEDYPMDMKRKIVAQYYPSLAVSISINNIMLWQTQKNRT